MFPEIDAAAQLRKKMRMQFPASCSLQSNGSLTLGDILLLLCYLQTRKYFVRNFKPLSKFMSHTTMKSQAGRKKSVGLGLPANRLAAPLIRMQKFPISVTHKDCQAFFCSGIKIPRCLALKVYSLLQMAKGGFAQVDLERVNLVFQMARTCHKRYPLGFYLGLQELHVYLLLQMQLQPLCICYQRLETQRD